MTTTTSTPARPPYSVEERYEAVSSHLRDVRRCLDLAADQLAELGLYDAAEITVQTRGRIGDLANGIITRRRREILTAHRDRRTPADNIAPALTSITGDPTATLSSLPFPPLMAEPFPQATRDEWPLIAPPAVGA